MKVFYKVRLTCLDYREERLDEIKQAAEALWPFVWDTDSDALCGEGVSQTGMEEQELADAIAAAIWRANERSCLVQQEMLCLEYLPYEIYELDESDYARVMGD